MVNVANDGKAKDERYTEDVNEVIGKEKQHIGKDKNEDLCGLALSGGGIRSAAFGLGVMQGLVEVNVLEKIDYLSTVSGGGFIGSSLTWFLQKGIPDEDVAGKEATDKEKSSGDKSYPTKAAGTSKEYFPFGYKKAGGRIATRKLRIKIKC